MRLHKATVICATLSSLVGASAWGSGFYLLEQNASGLGRAYAGSAAIADDASTIFFNPAGLARLEGVQISAAVSAINVDTRFHDAGSVAALGQPLGSAGGNAGGLAAIPAVYLSVPISPALTAGLGINAPFGLKTDYDTGWMGRYQGLRSEVQAINVNPALAWAPNERMSFAIGLNYQRMDATLTNAVNYSAVVYQGALQAGLNALQAAQLLGAAGPLEGAARVKGDDSGWGFNVGALFDIGSTTRVGLAYRSRLKYDVKGNAEFAAPATAVPTAALIIAGASAGQLANGPVSLDLQLPDTATVSLVQQLGDRGMLSFDVAWTGWSSVPELRIVRDSGTTLSVTPEDWKDSWRFAIGGDYRLNASWTLRGGLGYDQAPVPDVTRTPRMPDADRTWIALGAGWDPTEALHLDLGYAHLFVKNASLDQAAGSAAAYGLLAGTQKTRIDIFAAQLNYKF